MTAPIKRFRCRYCGEREPYRFNATLKSICSACRAQRERERVRMQTREFPVPERRAVPVIKDECLRTLYDFARER